MQESVTETITASELAEMYGVKRVTARAWLKRGIVPGAALKVTPVGGYWLIETTALKDFVPPKQGRPKLAKESDK